MMTAKEPPTDRFVSTCWLAVAAIMIVLPLLLLTLVAIDGIQGKRTMALNAFYHSELAREQRAAAIRAGRPLPPEPVVPATRKDVERAVREGVGDLAWYLINFGFVFMGIYILHRENILRRQGVKPLWED